MIGWHHHCHERVRYYHGGPHGRHHGHMPPWMAHEFFGGAKAERGEVRYLILDALKDGEGHGYQIIQTLKERSGGRYQPSPGAIYPTLQMLEEEGLLTSRRDGNRTLYSLTDAGRAELEEHLDEVEDAYDRLHGPWMGGGVDYSSFGGLFKRLARTIKSAYRRGKINQKNMDEVYSILDEAITRVEGILGK